MYSEVLDALKIQREIKLAQKQKYFVTRYSQVFSEMTANRLRYELISLIPQRVIEVVAFGSILTIAIYFSIYQRENISAITMIGMYAFATYRLMPAIADIFDGFEQIQFSSAILERLANEFKSQSYQSQGDEQIGKIKDSLSLESIGFDFGDSRAFRLENLTLTFKANQLYCVYGKTGCGKTTLMNILAGFYRPHAGRVLIDDHAVELYHNPSWQTQIGMVPAKVELIEASIAENIALGVGREKIDTDRLAELVKIVELDNLIERLPEGFDTIYGDEGLAFSSGQVQKVGIARALYHRPAVLLLDEATDAFDLETEKRVMDNIRGAYQSTIIFISHRLSIREYADHVIDLEAELRS